MANLRLNTVMVNHRRSKAMDSTRLRNNSTTSNTSSSRVTVTLPPQHQQYHQPQHQRPQGPPPQGYDAYGYPIAHGPGYGGSGPSRAAPPPPSGSQEFGHGAPQGYTFQYSNCTGRRRALLIGINYFGQNGELRGCINDVKNLSAYLMENHGYKREDMVTLTDDAQNPVMQPTKEKHPPPPWRAPRACSGSPPSPRSPAQALAESPSARTPAGDMGGVASTFLGFPKTPFRGNDAYEQTKRIKTSPADVIMWSGSKDDQTSADATIASQATGAMSWAFISALKQNPQQSYVQLLNSIRDVLETKYTQKPQLSCSHPLGYYDYD
ncbi:hypothetical protein CHGG_02096 [Chaetomium globosum CBS 148.51]|uniref:Peptidase C14 caspase domain-containing protein n=1 Tax=Chaetomium globosum (strain ATCC 6205 / CBS 148.51 / DSM 1962 / NBRC 6347 / NRRL 1970) TaxID=306901 RepID=Q2HCF8_CHAGB|nr:uncharacterized protein CHGG_02096 [Chaetomium globosum CBS 148.51]EAQ93861.1 hypothetical protein CHGG_02096 [Chaetomium globosum CBS 148.51]